MTIKDSKSTIADRLITVIANAERRTLGIDQLYLATMTREDPHLTQRKKQQALGPHIARLNKKLKLQKLRIEPGEARGPTVSLIPRRFDPVASTKLEAALAWARRGFRVFPLKANGRKPVLKAFSAAATTDEARIHQWWSGTSDYNIGVDTTGMVVIDVDVKNGKQGMESYTALGLGWDTLTVATPSGGYHAYYTGPDSRLSVEKALGPGLDIRSHHGYVIAPGSVIDGNEYSVVVDKPMAHVPDAVASRLEPPRPRDETLVSDTSWDTDANIAAAVNYLQCAEPAVEGQGGNSMTYETAAYCRDFGLSPGKILELVAQHYSPRCTPPWDHFELQQIVSNAWEYGSGSCGKLSPHHLFATVIPQEAPDVSKAEQSVRFGNIVPMDEIEPRPWIMTKLMMRRQITLLVAAGAAGKSTWSIALAAHLALGLDFCGSKCLVPGKSVIFNAEDDRTEMSRRLYACCAEYGLDFYKVRSKIVLIGRDELNLKLTRGQRPPALNDAHVSYLRELASDPEVVMVSLDPLIALHTAQEDDNVEMALVMEILMDLARDTDTSIMLSHHTSKGTSHTDNAGSDVAFRGAGAISTRVRISLTLFGASKEDCTKYHLREEDRFKYVRLDDAKLNLSAQGGEPVWMERKGVKLVNGDEVGVLAPVSLHASAEQAVVQVATMIYNAMMQQGKGSVSITEAAQMLITAHTLYSKLSIKIVKERVEQMLQGGVSLQPGVTIRSMRDTEQKSAPVIITIE